MEHGHIPFIQSYKVMHSFDISTIIILRFSISSFLFLKLLSVIVFLKCKTFINDQIECIQRKHFTILNVSAIKEMYNFIVT